MESHHRDLHRGVHMIGLFLLSAGIYLLISKPGECNARHFSNRTRSELKLLYRLRLGWQRIREWVALLHFNSNSLNVWVLQKGRGSGKEGAWWVWILDLWDRMLCCFQRCCFTFWQLFSHKTLSFLIEKRFKASGSSIAMARNIFIYNLWVKTQVQK